ncbi:MAG TPA: septum site-determining protein MinC [Methyloceanibacter sp.]|nr:septum site-determining protein MinC [Methyloceanibacter sp.]
MATAPSRSRSFQLHGRSFLAFVLKPETPIGRWIDEADSWLSRSPGFFSGKPVVVDISGLLLTKSKTAKLIADLAARGIRVMGMLGTDPAWTDADLPPTLSSERNPDAEASREKPGCQSKSRAPALAASRLIDQPVRSGQTLFHDGDVTIIGSVSSGAEIVATGSIHIYGALRGRVMAGADGNPGAHIFCRRMAAELLAIDGYYCMADEISANLLEKPVHAWLENNELNIKALD